MFNCKMAGDAIYKGETLYGYHGVSFDSIFDKIKNIITDKENTDRLIHPMHPRYLLTFADSINAHPVYYIHGALILY